MKKLLLLSFIFAVYHVYSQELHTPKQILEIIEKSEISYEINELKTKIDLPDRSGNVNLNNSYRVYKDSSMFTYKYEPSEEVLAWADSGEAYFVKGNTNKAREMYMKVLSIDPSYYKVITYIAQTYGIEKNYDESELWYKKAIEKNYIDYLAHWLLADIYRLKGNNQKALQEITIAHILNRNNPRLYKSFSEIYKLQKINYSPWYFNPQHQSEFVDHDHIVIKANMDWLGHALVKAVWQFEPGYSESMGDKENSAISVVREKEGLVAMLYTMDKKKMKKYPELNALQLALDNKQIEEYIFYEIILPDYPVVAYHLPESFIGNISDYIINTRSKVKAK
jgi:tetratricopeptide (TPR) repeat protein